MSTTPIQDEESFPATRSDDGSEHIDVDQINADIDRVIDAYGKSLFPAVPNSLTDRLHDHLLKLIDMVAEQVKHFSNETAGYATGHSALERAHKVLEQTGKDGRDLRGTYAFTLARVCSLLLSHHPNAR